MKVTGDEKGVRFLKQMYMEDQKDALGYLNHAKKRGVAYFRSLTPPKSYSLWEIRCTDGQTYNVAKFQEGVLSADEKL
jgi:hypothetical protein